MLIISAAYSQVLLNSNHLAICNGSSTTLTATGAVTYFWSPSAGLNSTQGNSVIASPSSTTTYTVTGVDQSGNSSYASVDVVVNQNPDLNISVAQASGCNFIPGLYQDPIYPDVKMISNVVYGQNALYNGQMTNLTLDIYMPNQLVNYKRPAVLLLHGGGFIYGDKTDSTVTVLSNFLAHRGYVVYNANYRKGMQQANQANAGNAYYRAVQDAKCCVRYIRKTGVQYGIDTSQIFIGGFSAGAMTSIAVAYMDQQDVPSWISYSSLGNLEDAGGNTGFSSRVKAVVSISGGVYDTTSIFDDETEPIYSFHGTNDGTIPYTSGLSYGIMVYGGYTVNQKAIESGINSTLHTFIGGGHMPAQSSPQMDTVIRESAAFIFSQTNFQHGENSVAMVSLSGAGSWLWTPNLWLSSDTAANIIAQPLINKIYTVTGTTSAGCSAQQTIELKCVLPLSVSIKIDTVQNHLNLYAVVVGGQGIYSYLWSNGSTASFINHVGEGNYSVTVNSADCTTNTGVEIIFPELTTATAFKLDTVTSCHAAVSWVPMPDALYQRIILTNTDDSSSTQLISFMNPYNGNYEWNELLPSTNYKAEVIAYTWNNETAGASTLLFKTKMCEAPFVLFESNVQSVSATVNWTSNCNADAYRLKIRRVGDPAWSFLTLNDTHYDFTGLQPGTTYEYFVRTICSANLPYSKKSYLKTFTTTDSRKENVLLKTENDFQVYPNPCNGSFTIHAALPVSSESAIIELYNSLGQIVIEKRIITEEGSIELSMELPKNYPAGVYQLRIKSGNILLNRTIVVRN